MSNFYVRSGMILIGSSIVGGQLKNWVLGLGIGFLFLALIYNND